MYKYDKTKKHKNIIDFQFNTIFWGLELMVDYSLPYIIDT